MRILAFIEAATVTGPAKNLLEFGRLARPEANLRIATFRRAVAGRGGEAQQGRWNATGGDVFLREAARVEIPVAVIADRHAADLRVADAMQQLAAELDAEIVQTHGVKSHFLWAWGARKLSQRRPLWVAWHHGYTQPSWKQRFYNEFDRWSLPQANIVITVTEAFAEQLQARGVRREAIHCVGNSVWPAAVRQRGFCPDRQAETVVLGVGRLSEEKNFGLLIRAVSRLRSEGWNLRLVIAGEGPQRTLLQQQAREHKVPLDLPGQVQNLEPYWDIAAVYVCSSRSEGSPNAVLEAMARALPVVATKVGGVPEMIVDGEHGLLCASGEEGAMADCLRRLLRDQELRERLGRAAHERVAREFSPVGRTAAILRLYAQLGETRR